MASDIITVEIDQKQVEEILRSLELTTKAVRVLTAAVRKVHADDAVFLFNSGKIAGDLAAWQAEVKSAEFELQRAVRELTSAGGSG